jgi:hypothetical protein
MRVPGSLKELSAQLGAFSGRLVRVTVPTKLGPFVLEFGDVQVTAPIQVSAPVAEKTAERPLKFIPGTELPDDDSPLHPFQVLSASKDYRGPTS